MYTAALLVQSETATDKCDQGISKKFEKRFVSFKSNCTFNKKKLFGRTKPSNTSTKRLVKAVTVATSL